MKIFFVNFKKSSMCRLLGICYMGLPRTRVSVYGIFPEPENVVYSYVEHMRVKCKIWSGERGLDEYHVYNMF